MTPRLAVVIPLFNKADYVLDALHSLQAQSELPDEVVVVDDGSTDDGAARVQALNWHRVRLVRQANAGVSVARNQGIAATTAELVAFLDADDLYRPGQVAAMKGLAAAYPEAVFVATGYETLDAQGRTCPVTLPGWPIGQSGLVQDFFSAWRRTSFTFTSAIAVRRQHLTQHGLCFPVGERWGEDQDLWFRLAELGPLAYRSEALSVYRTEVSGSATQGHRPSQPLPCYARLADRLANGCVPLALRKGAEDLVATHWINVAWAQWAAGRRAEAWALLRDAKAWKRPVYAARTTFELLVSTGWPKADA